MSLDLERDRFRSFFLRLRSFERDRDRRPILNFHNLDVFFLFYGQFLLSHFEIVLSGDNCRCDSVFRSRRFLVSASVSSSAASAHWGSHLSAHGAANSRDRTAKTSWRAGTAHAATGSASHSGSAAAHVRHVGHASSGVLLWWRTVDGQRDEVLASEENETQCSFFLPDRSLS